MLNPETVKGFAEAHYKPFLRDNKKIKYEFEFQKLDGICEFLGEKLIDEVSKLDVLGFETWLLERPYKHGEAEKKRSDASANRCLSRLRGLLSFAERSANERTIFHSKTSSPKKT